jgi:hypothetical protein
LTFKHLGSLRGFGVMIYIVSFFYIYDFDLVWLCGSRTAGEVLVHDLNGFLSDAAGYVDCYREFRLLRRVTFLSIAKEK